MKNLRRVCSLIVLLVVSLPLLHLRGGIAASSAKKYRAYVGTYTAKTNSKGIYEFDFDSTTGKMSAAQVAGETTDPSWVVVHPNGRFLYSVNEAGKASTVSAFAIEPGGKLTLLNQLPSLGEDPCYLSFDKSGKFLFVANYTSGNVVVYPVRPDGKLGEHTANATDQGAAGPNKERQEGPHAHWIDIDTGATSPMTAGVYVADLGLDRVLVYQFHGANGELSGPSIFSTYSHRKFDPSANLSPGTGPRHAAFSKDHTRMYVLGELNSTITAFHMTGMDDFVPTGFQKISTLPEGFSGRNDAAEIEIHPSGKFLYASNRGEDSIVVYVIDAKSGKLTMAQDVPTGGKEPRHFAIDPSGHFLLAENQLSDTIVEFRIDPASGKLTPTGETLSVPSPVCITFLPDE